MKRSTAAHEKYDFGEAGRLLFDFFWGEFADWYIEAAKARLYGQDQQAALQTRQVSLVLTLALQGCTVMYAAGVFSYHVQHSLDSLCNPTSS